MRTILYGVAYRGGANNYYHKQNKRENKNPIPKDGMANLSAEGFSKVVYLYATNYAGADKYYVNSDSKDTLFYLQNSLSDRKKIKEVMLLIMDVINSKDKGPVYLHCWNGWHQSGFISAAILMQFCNYSNEDALKYWIKNTDGVTKGYDHIQKMIREFKKFDDIKIDESIKKEICPCMD
jgi:protein tyrosine/serine phosphatase